MMQAHSDVQRRALWSLFLLVPVPSLGVLCGMILFPDTRLGQMLFGVSKGWLLLFPAVWFFGIERAVWRRGKTRPGGLCMGGWTGLGLGGAVLILAWLFGPALIDGEAFRAGIAKVGLDRPAVYVAGALYWVCINSVLEEYVWRWFVVRQVSVLLRPVGAVVASAIGFSLHHFLAMQLYFDGSVALLCTFGVFVGGLVWSWMFVRYETIWPGWISHAIVDVAVFGAGYVLLFC